MLAIGLRGVVTAVAAMALLSACSESPPEVEPMLLPATLPDAASFAQALFEKTNAAREEAGLPRLAWSECAKDLALPRARHTLPQDVLSHEPLVPSCEGFDYLGENLSRAHSTPAQVITAWLDSPGHRQNLLDPAFTEVGVGCLPYEAANPSIPASGSSEVGGMACSEVFLGYVP